MGDVCLQREAMFCLYTSSRPQAITLPPIIWIFTGGEDDGIESILSSKIFSTLPTSGNIFTSTGFIDFKNIQEIEVP